MEKPTGRLRVGLARAACGKVAIADDVLAMLDATAALLAEVGHEIEGIDTPGDPENIMVGVMNGFKLDLAHNPRNVT